MSRRSWPRPPEVREYADGTKVTLYAFGNPVSGVTFWGYRLEDGARVVLDSSATTHIGARFAARSALKSYNRNRG